MAFFSTKRERKLWLWALIVVVAIYATLGVAQILAAELRDRGLISDAIWVGLWLIALAILLQGLRARPGGVEIGIALGVAGAYLIAMLRMTLPEERSHLIEYSVVAFLIYEALGERARAGRHVPRPALLAIGLTTLVGIVDELIQFVLPNRVFDLFDISFNFIAAVMAVSGMAVLGWARRRFNPRVT